MHRHALRHFILLLTLALGSLPAFAQVTYRSIPVSEFLDKMKSGWVGQMAGVGWGGPTEFRWKGQIIPDDKMPLWTPDMINQFNQDDIYVEMTFVRTLEEYGLDADLRQAGIDFANSEYALWHANRYGRENLRQGIAPPDSGHPQFNSHADDIDYQIEADFSGLIAPGLPNFAIALGEKFGRLMNYGDGLYGGQFVGGMYAEAFFESDPVKIVQAGLKCIPPESQYAETIRDVLAWHAESPDDWQAVWEKINEKYQKNLAYRRFSCGGPDSDFNIDAKINGAYIVMGLLFGKGDLDQTIRIATRCGQDSDCNPASAGGILFTTVGYSHLPERFTSALNEENKFSHTAYNFPALIDVCSRLARAAILQAGGRIETDANGNEIFVIPNLPPKPSPLESCWEPRPPAGSRFTDKEKAKITHLPFTEAFQQKMAKALEQFAPGWSISQCGEDMNPGRLDAFQGRANVLLTHPLNQEQPCILRRTIEVPSGGKTILHLLVNHHPQGDWVLIVKANGEEMYHNTIGVIEGWIGVNVDLSRFAGQAVNVEMLNQANGWAFEAAYWS